MTKADCKPVIPASCDRYRVFQPGNKPILLQYWSLTDVLLSEICLVAVLVPQTDDERRNDRSSNSKRVPWTQGAKEELNFAMQHLKRLVMGHDVMCPVVAVVQRDAAFFASHEEAIKEIKRWPADQEWHRGAFLLYLDDAEAKESSGSPKDIQVLLLQDRLHDLLTGQPIAWQQLEQKPARSWESILQEVRKRVGEDVADEAVRAIVFSLLDVLVTSKEDIKDKDRFQLLLKGWAEDQREPRGPDMDKFRTIAAPKSAATSTDTTTQPNHSSGRIIGKIKRFTIRDFRGLVGEHKFDTDADIVLLAGPNGYGKTSFIEALLLLLTDYQYYPQKGNGHGSAENLFSLTRQSRNQRGHSQ